MAEINANAEVPLDYKLFMNIYSRGADKLGLRGQMYWQLIELGVQLLWKATGCLVI